MKSIQVGARGKDHTEVGQVWTGRKGDAQVGQVVHSGDHSTGRVDLSSLDLQARGPCGPAGSPFAPPSGSSRSSSLAAP